MSLHAVHIGHVDSGVATPAAIVNNRRSTWTFSPDRVRQLLALVVAIRRIHPRSSIIQVHTG